MVQSLAKRVPEPTRNLGLERPPGRQAPTENLDQSESPEQSKKSTLLKPNSLLKKPEQNQEQPKHTCWHQKLSWEPQIWIGIELTKKKPKT